MFSLILAALLALPPVPQTDATPAVSAPAVTAPAVNTKPKPKLAPPIVATPDPISVLIPTNPLIVEVGLDGPTSVDSKGSFMVIVTKPEGVDPKDVDIRWNNDIPANARSVQLTDAATGKPVLLFLNPPDGIYAFRLSAQVSVDKADGFDPRGEATLTTTVGVPSVVVPPVVDPNNPPPVVTPPVDDSTAKVKTKGFRCLFSIEKDFGIPDVIADPALYAYLNSHVVKGEDGKTPDWRIVDNDEAVDKDFKVFKDYRATMPPGSGTTGTEDPYASFGDGTRGAVVNLKGMTSADLLKQLQTIGGN